MNRPDLYILFIPDPEGGESPELEMGGTKNYNARYRTFAVRGSAINFARKHGAKVAHLHFPAAGDPYVVGVIDPAD